MKNISTFREYSAARNFENFVQKLVGSWATKINEQRGVLADADQQVTRTQQGSEAEEYIVKKIERMSDSYHVCRSQGSRSPADVFALHKGRRTPNNKPFWHLMLIQVKSSKNQNNIESLNQTDIDNLKKLAAIAKTLIQNESWYKDQPLFISTGYAGVWRIEGGTTRHELRGTDFFDRVWLNKGDISYSDVEPTIISAHFLSLKAIRNG